MYPFRQSGAKHVRVTQNQVRVLAYDFGAGTQTSVRFRGYGAHVHKLRAHLTLDETVSLVL